MGLHSPLRGAKLAALLLVAYSVGVSTLLFQTLTNNPILTPVRVGFDATLRLPANPARVRARQHGLHSSSRHTANLRRNWPPCSVSLLFSLLL